MNDGNRKSDHHDVADAEDHIQTGGDDYKHSGGERKKSEVEMELRNKIMNDDVKEIKVEF